MPNRECAFTLIELILVVTIIITLSLIAIPTYSKSKQRVMQKEGISNLKLIAAAERIYKMEVTPPGDYVDCNCSSVANCLNSTGCNTLLKLLLNTTNWTYGVVTAGVVGSKTATITATGPSSCTYTLINTDFDTQDYSTKTAGCI